MNKNEYTFIAEFTERVYRHDDGEQIDDVVTYERRTFKSWAGVSRVYDYWRNNERQAVAMSILDFSGNIIRQFQRDVNFNVCIDR